MKLDDERESDNFEDRRSSGGGMGRVGGPRPNQRQSVGRGRAVSGAVSPRSYNFSVGHNESQEAIAPRKFV